MKNRKVNLICQFVMILFLGIIAGFLAGDLVVIITGNGILGVIGLPVGAAVFWYYFARSGILYVKKMDRIEKKTISEGMSEEIISEMEAMLVGQYNQLHIFHRLDKSALENNNFEPFIDTGFAKLFVLISLYNGMGKRDKAAILAEQIRSSDTFCKWKENPLMNTKMVVAGFYVIALQVYMEMENMSKVDEYMSEGRPYMEACKDDKGTIGAGICVCHVRYQFLKGNYELALKWLNQYDFPENSNVLRSRFEMYAWIYYAENDLEQAEICLKKAEEYCTSQWAKDKLYREYEDMKKRLEMRTIQLSLN